MNMLLRYKSLPLAILAAFLLQLAAPGIAAAGDEPLPKVENIHFDQSGNIITVYYDLKASSEHAYKVSVKLRREGDAIFEYLPGNLSGDVGKDVGAGNGKKIFWNL